MGAIHVEDSIQIDRPVEDVFSYMADPQHMPEWTAVVVEVRTDASAPLSAGDNFTVAQKFLGTKWESLCEILSSKRTGSATGALGAPYRSPSRSPVSHPPLVRGSRLWPRASLAPSSGWPAPLFERAARRQVRDDLETVRDLLTA